MKHEKENKPVEAIFVKVLENKPKGVTKRWIRKNGFANQTFKLPQGPALINGQWV
tara:strand:- start:1384 stop:1548 length:165 start_codon:yes stop_codon:yes gene_type:complete